MKKDEVLLNATLDAYNRALEDIIKESRLTRKEIRRELKSLKRDLRQLAAEACYRDRAWGEQIDQMADRVGEMVEKI